jgi:hypothetical protein
MNDIKNFILSLPTELVGYLIFDLNKAMRKNKRLDVLNPIPQSSPYLLGEEHKELFEKARQLIEEKWQTKLEEVDDDLEIKILSELREAEWEKFKAEEGYDEAEAEALLNELRKISPYKPTPPELRAVPVS